MSILLGAIGLVWGFMVWSGVNVRGQPNSAAPTVTATDSMARALTPTAVVQGAAPLAIASPDASAAIPTPVVPATAAPAYPPPAPSPDTAPPDAGWLPDAYPGPGAAPVTANPVAAVQAPYRGIWLGAAELAALPMCGPGWQNVKSAADYNVGRPNLRDQEDENNVYVLAKALVYARTGEEHYREEVLANIEAAMGTEEGGRSLALSRNLVAYVIAADLVNLPADAELDRQFRAWLREMLDKEFKDGGTLRTVHEGRPNNWGTHAGASRAAVAVYLGDWDELARTAQVFRGWLGDHTAYTDFTYGRLTWQAQPDKPVGVNPVGATKEGYSIDGALPEEMRRGGNFRWPPKETGYPWEALQGAVVQAEILHRAGYPAWEWQDQALLRAARFLYSIGWEADGDDNWQPWLINTVYDAGFATVTPTRPGKNMGWTDWTHAPAADHSCLPGSGRQDSRINLLILAAEDREKSCNSCATQP